MNILRQMIVSRVAVRLMFAAGAAALMAGCSDASRFSSDPFADPFRSSGAASRGLASRSVDRAPTGSIASAPAGQVQSSPLPPPNGAPAPSQPAAPVAQAPMPAGAYNHWAAEGGTPIVVAEGETAGMLANRYGVPADALLRVNGYSSSSQVQPGSRLVVPVYRATTAAAPKPAAAPALKTAKADEADAAPKAHKGAKPQEAKRASAKTAKADDEADTPAAKGWRKGPNAAKGKTAKAQPVKSDDDEAPKTARKSKDRHAEAQPAPAKLKTAALKQDDDEEEVTRPAKAASKPAAKAETPARVARVEAPVEAAPAPREQAKAEPQKPAEPSATVQPKSVDRTATSSIPPAGADSRPEFRWPAHGRIIQGFTSGGNDGINIALPEGTQVKAAEGGVVAYAGGELKGYGNLVLIRHPNGYVTAYAHNGEIAVKRGDQVSRGQTIARSGQSGNVGSPQLHFELRKGSTPVDPTNYLAGL